MIPPDSHFPHMGSRHVWWHKDASRTPKIPPHLAFVLLLLLYPPTDTVPAAGVLTALTALMVLMVVVVVVVAVPSSASDSVMLNAPDPPVACHPQSTRRHRPLEVKRRSMVSHAAAHVLRARHARRLRVEKEAKSTKATDNRLFVFLLRLFRWPGRPPRLVPLR